MLGMGPQGAMGIQKFFVFWAYTTPIGGAIIADQYIGRYKTIIWGCILYILGEVILVVTSIPLDSISRGVHIGGFIASIIVIGLGTGGQISSLITLTAGIKSNVSALVAEQCAGTTRLLKKIGNQMVIVDPAVTTERIYMYFYFAINLGSLGSLITATLEHKVGFWAAYTVPLVAFAAALAIVLGGRRKYVLRKPQGSILLDSFKAMSIAVRNKWDLDAAKPARSPGVKWDDQFIEELKRSLVACKVTGLPSLVN
jgi:proton-dependent oligopeptide transporter, POT family